VPLLVVGTARPELLARRPGWSGGKPNALTLSLAPLSEEDTARLIGSLLGRAVLEAEPHWYGSRHSGCDLRRSARIRFDGVARRTCARLCTLTVT